MYQAENTQSPSNLNFENTEIAFRSKTNSDLQRSFLLFKAIGYNWLVKLGTPLIEFAFSIKLPIVGLIKATVFKQFCGGETMNECDPTMKALHEYGIGSILDYSVEGKEAEAEFEHTTKETIETIEKAGHNPMIPFCVFKVTGVARFDLLAKVNDKAALSQSEQVEFDKINERVERICKTAYNNGVRIFIDAEETWIQDAIDALAREMMLKFNNETAIIYNTIQFYRHDRFAFLKNSFEDALKHNYQLGIKLVRGAYMEKEAARAQTFGYPNPIQPNKESSNNDYNDALLFCVNKIERISICAGTHNEQSSMLLANLMMQNGIQPNDKRIYFSQLFGMSDHISYNLSSAGYNVAKYLPYGPVKSVMPYLFRRAAENTSVKGQSGRELGLIAKEVKRRKKANN